MTELLRKLLNLREAIRASTEVAGSYNWRTPAGTRMLEIAERIARAAHCGQTEESTGDDYILHVQRVVNMVDREEAKSVAWLHDVIEDSLIRAGDLMNAGLPVSVVSAVVHLTRVPACESYAEYIERLKTAGPLALEVKAADLRDHLRPNCPEQLRPRYIKACITLGLTSHGHGCDRGGSNT